MLALARALVLDPQVLIADEVSLGLAPVVVDQLFDVLGDMHRRGTTILLAEQNARLALEAADVAYVLEAGRVLFHGPAADLRADPRIVDAYLQSLCDRPGLGWSRQALSPAVRNGCPQRLSATAPVILFAALS
jgi:ABC-type branched-subunit amino acid transport system ATPase component